MPENNTVIVRMFGVLHTRCREAGEPTTLTVDIPAEGCSASELAAIVDVPIDLVEGVFVNGDVHDVDWPVQPGDRVAFVPYGTPGPHRFYLGLYKAGKAKEARRE